MAGKLVGSLEFLRHDREVPPREEYFLLIRKVYDYVSFFAAGFRVEFKSADCRVVYGEAVNAKPFQIIALQETTLSGSAESNIARNKSLRRENTNLDKP